MKALVLTPYSDAYLVNLDPDSTTLDGLQSLVGGFIERIGNAGPGSLGRFDLWANEESSFQQLRLDSGEYSHWPINPLAHVMFRCGRVQGNVVVTGEVTPEGRIGTLTPTNLAAMRRTGVLWADADHELYGEWRIEELLERLAGDQMVKTPTP